MLAKLFATPARLSGLARPTAPSWRRPGRGEAEQFFLPHLFDPLRFGNTKLVNWIVSPGHDTVKVEDRQFSAQMVAYQTARAVRGAGLIVISAASVDESARHTTHVLMADDDSRGPGFGAVIEALAPCGCPVFGRISIWAMR
jgi:2,4-dienoyl-CoA reductase-like NADH-dependent reductase (Old Yellow Enzyme family)